MKKRQEKGDPRLLEGAAWFAQCPRHLRKRHGADFMVWAYLLIWVGAFEGGEHG